MNDYCSFYTTESTHFSNTCCVNYNLSISVKRINICTEIFGIFAFASAGEEPFKKENGM